MRKLKNNFFLEIFLENFHVFLTHLHFDHCGGAIEKADDGSLIPTFENASYWISKDHLYWAKNANDREKASFLKENIEPIEKSGKLNLIDTPKNNRYFSSTLSFEIVFVDGHTTVSYTHLTLPTICSV